ncbi:MAG: glycerol acyltransferase, partial [Chloroflexota bacterium]
MSKNPLINLTEINLDDLVSSFGWQDHRMAAFLLRLFFTGAARKFAMQMLEFDDLVSRYELPGGSKMALDRFASNLELSGTENIPKDGPVLFLSNHPGMVDTLALFSAINRNDLQIIALNRPFLVSLPAVARHLFFLSEDSV